MRIKSSLLIVLFTLGLGGCNTIEGMGEDLEAVGEEVDQEAEEQKGY